MRVTIRISGDMQGKRELEFKAPGEYVIGRVDKSAVIISDPSASKRHAVIIVDDMGVRLRDLGSTNGTIVDGTLLGGSLEPHSSGGASGTLVREKISMGEGPGLQADLQVNLRNGSLIEIGGAQIQVFIDLELLERDKLNEWLNEGEKKALEAIQIFRQVLALDPNNTRANLLLRQTHNLAEQFEDRGMEQP